MQNVPETNGNPFWRAFLFWGVSIGSYLLPHSMGVIPVWVEIPVKFVGTGVAAFVAAFITSLANDFYRLKVKNRIFKQKNNKEDGKDNERAA